MPKGRLWVSAVAALSFLAAARASDWPQLQHDAARSGFTKDAPAPPFRPSWDYDFAELSRDKIHPVVQAIVYGGKAFVPSKTGKVYAIDAATGDELWTWEGAGPIVNSVGCARGLVFFGSLDGKVYALKAADGTKAWEFFGGIRGLCTAPCLAEGKVFIGERSGAFYCLDQRTGGKIWESRPGGFIYHTAAYAGGKVFFGTEELKVVCLDARSGRVLWKTGQLVGITFMDGHAFVDGGKVVVRTWNAAINTAIGIGKDALNEAAAKGRWLRVPSEAQDRALAAIRKEPLRRRELYVFDAGTGRELYVPVHSKISTVDGPAFSVASDGRGGWILPVAAGGVTWLAFARMDPETGRLTEFIWTPDCKRSNCDEANAVSVGGNIVFCSEQEEGEAGIFTAFDLDRARQVPITRRGGREGRFKYSIDWNMEFNGQPLCNAIAISGNRFYKITNHSLRCWIGTGK